MDGWTKPKKAATYAGVTIKTFRNWLKEGLRHSRLPSGRILIRYADIDAYLERFQITEAEIDKQVNDILRDF